MSEQIEQQAGFAAIRQTPAVGQAASEEARQPAQAQPEAVNQSKDQLTSPKNDKTAPEWHQLIGAARLMWSKLSETELLASEGEEQRLTNIVSARYVLSHNTANAQVKKFLATQVIADCFKP